MVEPSPEPELEPRLARCRRWASLLRGQIAPESFLFVGLVAVVRRI